MPYTPPARQHEAGSWRRLFELAQFPAKPVPFSGVSGGTPLYSGRCILTGGLLHNGNAGSVVTVLRNGLDATGAKVWQISAGTLSNQNIILPGQGVLCDLGVFLDAPAGPLDGSVFVIPLWEYPFTGPGE